MSQWYLYIKPHKNSARETVLSLKITICFCLHLLPSYLILFLSLFLAVSHFILSSSITFTNQWPISFLILPFTFIFLLNVIHIQDRNRYVVCTPFTALSLFSLCNCAFIWLVFLLYLTHSLFHIEICTNFWQTFSPIVSYKTCLEMFTIFMENKHQRCNKSATWR